MNKKYDLPELDDLPEDFDPMEMAAFLDGEANTKLVRGLTESSAMRAVAAAGLDTGLIADVEASEALAARARLAFWPRLRPGWAQTGARLRRAWFLASLDLEPVWRAAWAWVKPA